MFKRKIYKGLHALAVITVAASGYTMLTSCSVENSKAASSAELQAVQEETIEPTIFQPPATPKELSLFGETMPLQYTDVFESLDREVYTNCYYHSSTIRVLKLAPRYFPIIMPILKEEGVPEDFAYLAVAESGLNPIAKSPAGAVGLWQFMSDTAKEYGLEINSEVDERYHIEKATRAACTYLKRSYKKFGNWTAVAASYNAGSAGVYRQMTRQKQDDYYDLLLNQETARYVFRIAALKVIMQNPMQFGFDVPEEQKYEAWNTRDIEVSGAVESFPDWSIEHGTNYKILKLLNPWLRDDKLSNSRGKTYHIQLPLEGERL